MRLQPFGFSFFALGTQNELQVYAESSTHAEKMASCAINEIKRIESKFSRYQPDSMLSGINAGAGKTPIRVDEETASLLDYADTCFKESTGLFDITSGVLRKAWRFSDGYLPSDTEIKNLLPFIGWGNVEWSRPYIRLPREGMEIDFGGIGKEYATDSAAGLLLKDGVKHGLINLGGDVRVIGPRPDGSPWKVGVCHPREKASVIGEIDLTQGSLATSGDYERYMLVDGKRYSHILNPQTGYPVSGFQSVSVTQDSCLVCGSASTIAMLLEEEKGKKFLQNLGLPYLYICGDGRAKATPPFRITQARGT